ncbi:MAG: hypothetical protein QOE05_2690 [Actinomycetota bacterium]|nr:hypothetical protein [Actinomycetota bacterium]
MTVRRVVIVGAGVAGVTAVEALRDAGFSGHITVLDADGRPPYDRPPLSKSALAEGVPVDLRPQSVWDRLDVDLQLGVTALGVDVAGHTVSTSVGTLGYDRLLLATGGIARWPRALRQLAGTAVLRTADDALALRGRLVEGARLVVVGAGLVGCEVAATARRLGVHVTLVDPVQLPLAGVVGEEIATALLDRHSAEGVDVRTGQGAVGLVGEHSVEAVELDDGTRLPADAVLVAVGGAAASAWLVGSGLALAEPAPDGGVRCTRALQAGPDVFVAGDLAVPDGVGRSEHWMAAVEQAEVAAANLLSTAGEQREWVPAPYFWTDQYDVKVQVVGVPPAEPPALRDASADGRRQLQVWADGEGRAVAAATVNWPARAMAWRERVRLAEPIDGFVTAKATA